MQLNLKKIIFFIKFNSMVCLFILISTSAYAKSLTIKEAVDTLNQFIKQEEYALALAFSQENVFDFAGEPKFDFLTGIAAIKIGEYQRAVFALERAVIVKPKWKLARFNLAKAYFYIDNFLAAKNELKKLQTRVNDEILKKTILQFLQRIDQVLITKKRQLKQLYGLSFGHDTNINSGAILDEFETPLLSQPIQISEDSQAIEDEAIYLNYQLQYQLPINQQRLVIGELALFHTDYIDSKNDKFQSSIAQLSSKFQDVWGDKTYQLGAYVRPLLLDSSLYRNQYGFDANLIMPFNKNLNFGIQFGLGKTDYEDINDLDSQDIFFALSAQYTKGAMWHQISSHFNQISANQKSSDFNSYKLVLLQYQTSYFISQYHQLNLLLQYQDYNYKDMHPFWLATREEELYRGSLSWRYYLEDDWTWQLSLKHAQKQSNLPIYEYKRDEISLGIMKQF
ncbi:surface lipoprotein assembly modifier [Pseudoalteromonas denitrificans]|uniref:Uncharacterized protein n=1 Tax=Pseudoalteromonas denitrificans DSM 6059 TaxID=1123010 RepID=A0A1I1KUH3_9GAMM|nr:surface lipoprotein assembly modifier [Pseudoalteromonas denitrificans]SFC62378.1 Protein of unknown function [Pseudoalteromonas denitrificans DSM 6059]